MHFCYFKKNILRFFFVYLLGLSIVLLLNAKMIVKCSDLICNSYVNLFTFLSTRKVLKPGQVQQGSKFPKKVIINIL